MIGGGAVVGKVLGRRKWAKKGRRVYKRGFRGCYLQAKPGGAISAKTAGQCGRGQMRMGIHPEVFSTFLVSTFAVTACFLSNDMMFLSFDAPTRTR